MKATIEFSGSVGTDADTEDGIAQVAGDLLNDLDSALATWRSISETMGWGFTLTGRVLREDGQLLFTLEDRSVE